MIEKKTLAEQYIKQNLEKSVVLPTHNDLIDARKYGLTILKFNPYAVYVKKINSKQRHLIMSNNNIESDKNLIEDLHKNFNFEFLLNLQLATGMKFSKTELQYVEEIQNTPKLKSKCMYEQTYKASKTDFESQLKDFKNRNENVEIIPVSEVFTNDVIGKIAIAKKYNIRKYAIIFRSYKTYSANLSKFLSNLRVAGIKSIVFGICPTKWNKTNASMLLPPIRFKADYISSWIAWGGRATPVTLLCDDWTFKDLDNSDEGFIVYDGKDRKQIITNKTSMTFNTSFKKIDTINQANMLCRAIKPLRKVQFESLFD